ncbi:telomere length regulation protein-domain-containing protein [Globomyces pollinis-pini]|nr:telomere length regulation protein-domain-containing protein [Globomyces pollinis-pini]
MVNNIQPILPRLANELTPKYISQAIALIKSNEPDKIEVALKHLEGLFTKASRLELEENSKAICSLLISLENEFELENFTTMHCSAFVVLCLREQKFTSQIMCQSLFLKDIPMICRLNILRIFLAVVMTCDENSTVGWTVSCTNISTLYTTTMLNLLEINK